MNTYFKAISEATCNGKLPEYFDLWRSFHPYAAMSDSDYLYVDDLVEFDAEIIEEVCRV
jgi:hypothetical protein